MHSSGNTFPAKRASRRRSRRSWNPHEPIHIQDAGFGRRYRGCRDCRLAYQTGRYGERRSPDGGGGAGQGGGGSPRRGGRGGGGGRGGAGGEGGGRPAAVGVESA